MTKENITERVKGGGVSTSMGGSSSMPVKTGGSGGRNNPTTTTTTKTPIRKIDPKQFDNRSAAVTTNTPTGGSLKAGSFGISKAGRDQAAQNRAEFKAKIDAVKASSNTSSSSMSARDKFKSKFIKKDKGVGFVKRGTPGAQRAENKEKARLRAQAMAKARIEAKKKAGEQGNSTQSSSSSQTMTASYTPDMDAYDMVLEYLFSTEQVSSLEEANYVMMQLDEENIQEIVGKVAKVIMKTPLVKLVPATAGVGVATKMIASKMGQQSGQNQIKNSTPQTPVTTPVKKKKGNFITNFINKARDESSFGGNKRVDDTRQGSGDDTVGKKIKF